MWRRGDPSPLARDLLVSVGGLFIVRGVAAVSGVLVARLLGPAMRGDYAVVFFVAGLVGTAATLGLEYWVAAATARGHPFARVYAVVRAHGFRTAAALPVLGVAAAVALDLWHATLHGSVALVATGLALANVVAMLRLALLGGERRLLKVATAQILGAAVYATMLGLLLAVEQPSLDLVVTAAFASTLTVAVAARPGSRRRGVVERRDLAAAYKVGVPGMLGEVASLAASRLDLVAVAILLGSADVGRYAVAIGLAELLSVVPNGVSQVLLPQVAADERGRATGPIVALTIVIGGAAACVLTAGGGALIGPVFGPGFVAARDALGWTAAAAVIAGGWKILLADLAARGKTAVRLATAAAATVVMLVGDAVLAPRLGIQGAGIASLLAYAVAFVGTVRAWAHTGGVVGELYDLRSSARLVRNALRRIRSSTGTANAPAEDE